MSSTKTKTVKQIIHFPKLQRRPSYSRQPEYKYYRPEILEDCRRRCVYCDTHENELGGPEVKVLTLDHFRPQKTYPSLTNDPTNLVVACSRCNTLKGSLWPAYGHRGLVHGSAGYIDPFADNRAEYFSIGQDGKLTPIKTPAKFLIEHFALNRDFLMLNRLLRNMANAAYLQAFKLLLHHEQEHELLEQLVFQDRKPLSEDQKRIFKREIIVHKQFEIAIKQMLFFMETYITRLD
jgi:5-methylcytosine-specific restriction endonuclease McrA